MYEPKIGDRVIIKDRPDWPLPGGYRLANLEAKVINIDDEISRYIWVIPDKDITGLDIRIPLAFQAEAVEKI